MAEVGECRAEPQRQKERTVSSRNQRDSRDENGADRSKRERVGEVPVIFDGQQRVRFAPDEHVRVWYERRKSADPRCGASQLLSERDVTQTATEKNMSQR